MHKRTNSKRSLFPGVMAKRGYSPGALHGWGGGSWKGWNRREGKKSRMPSSPSKQNTRCWSWRLAELTRCSKSAMFCHHSIPKKVLGYGLVSRLSTRNGRSGQLYTSLSTKGGKHTGDIESRAAIAQNLTKWSLTFFCSSSCHFSQLNIHANRHLESFHCLFVFRAGKIVAWIISSCSIF